MCIEKDERYRCVQVGDSTAFILGPKLFSRCASDVAGKRVRMPVHGIRVLQTSLRKSCKPRFKPLTLHWQRPQTRQMPAKGDSRRKDEEDFVSSTRTGNGPCDHTGGSG